MTFAVIFNFSNQNAEKSGGLSEKVTRYIIDINPLTKDIQGQERENIIYKLESVIRKLAHFSIYTLVGLLLMTLISTYNLKEIDKIGISLIIGVIYASSDEIHQAFIPGRGAQITDVMLDSLGVLLGIFIVLFIVEMIRKIRRNIYDNINIKILK